MVRSQSGTELDTTLKRVFGYDAFHPGQRELISALVAGRDVFALMPTGAGKSLIYQLAALLRAGTGIVISPLIALMQDQVERLHANGITAAFINSAISPAERQAYEAAALRGEIKLIYLAPERLMTPTTLAWLDALQQRKGLALLAIDEAHCVSEWGHEFRPEYRQIGEVRGRFANIPTVALTATATPRVRQDILAQLGLHDPLVHIASFNRPNLFYEVRPKDKTSFADLVKTLREDREASTIIYCQSRRGVDDLSASLRDAHINALPYHAGMSTEERRDHQQRFVRDDVPVLVATIAFGMGIAKPDVRRVIHYDLPKSLEGYYQESGRAGRDGLPALCRVYFGYGDRMKIAHMIDQQESEEQRALGHEQLRAVINWLQDSSCRRRALLGYFGERGLPATCDSCDNCRNAGPPEDCTVDAQKLLSCIGRTGERFGLAHIIAILRGSRSQRILELGHDQLSTYGVGRDQSEDAWRNLASGLLAQQILREETGQSREGRSFTTLALTPAAWEVLRGQRPILLRPTRRPEPTPPPAPTGRTPESQMEAAAWDDTLIGLFGELRALRKQLADEQAVPPFVIFSDNSLRAMVNQRPATIAQFMLISGVGQRKAEHYGEIFLSTIGRYCVEHHIALRDPGVTGPSSDPDIPPERRTRANRGDAIPPYQQTLALWRTGLDITEIARRRGYAPSTIAGHLEKAIELGEVTERDRLVTPARFTRIVAAMRQVGDERLTPIREALGEDFSYEEILIVRAFLKKDHEDR